MLLCSDGLTSYSSVEDIERLINSSLDPQIVCNELITCALAGGGRDNITVIVEWIATVGTFGSQRSIQS